MMYKMHVFTLRIHAIVPKGAVPKGINNLGMWLSAFKGNLASKFRNTRTIFALRPYVDYSSHSASRSVPGKTSRSASAAHPAARCDGPHRHRIRNGQREPPAREVGRHHHRSISCHHWNPGDCVQGKISSGWNNRRHSDHGY